jgi:ATP-dependent RNA helicase RhlE
MPFAAFGLLPELTRALADRNYMQPTPVQARVIPEILGGRDILAGAQTGTGKTAGFALPLLQRLHALPNPPRAPRAVVLVPTRELAAQVADSIKSYGKYLRLRTLVIFGGVSINPQIDALARGLTSWSQRPAVCSIMPSREPSISRASRFWCSTKLIGCSTWGSSPTSAA